jgi:hypothetical protein
MSDLQDIIVSSSIKAFNAGYAAGKQEVLSAIETVAFDYHDLEVAAVSDLKDELKIRETSYHSNGAPYVGIVSSDD